LRDRREYRISLAQKEVSVLAAAGDPRLDLVLLVEDDRDNREMYTLALEWDGFRVREAVNGLDGYNAAIATAPDIVVTDIVMPAMDGLTMCRRLREHDATRGTPVIAVTARIPDATTLDTLHEIGAEAILLKPCEPYRLVLEVRKILARGAGLRERSRTILDRAHRIQERSAALLEKGVQHGELRQQLLTRSNIAQRIRGEFLEMPGLRVTLEQGARLWSVDPQTLADTLRHLVEDDFLRINNGCYLRK
jgi:DNA-binding response OmpR family regulator